MQIKLAVVVVVDLLRSTRLDAALRVTEASNKRLNGASFAGDNLNLAISFVLYTLPIKCRKQKNLRQR